MTSKSQKDKSGVPAQHAGRAAELGEYYKKAMVWLAVVYSIVLIRVPQTRLAVETLRHHLAECDQDTETVRGILFKIISWMLHYEHIAA